MSLASAYDSISAGCVAVPQHGFSAIEPMARYQVTFVRPGQRTFYRFSYNVQLEWDCPSPPAVVRLSMYERPGVVTDTDPIFHCDCFLVACSSPGTSLGSSRWFSCTLLNCNFGANPPFFIRWIHLQNYKTNTDSIGLIQTPFWPPVWPI